MSAACNCLSKGRTAIKLGLSLPNELRSAARRTYAISHTPTATALCRSASPKSSQCSFSSKMCPSQSPALVSSSTLIQSRPFSNSTPRCKLKTIEQVKARNQGGPFNLTAAVLFVGAGVGLYFYFTYEKERMARERIASQTKGIGKPKVGGPFELVDHEGRPFTEKDLEGKYSLIYFGFTHCPDICPDELDKMALMIDKVKEKRGDVLIPIMISCDPARDNPAVLKEYLKEFHPDIIGLTGEYENVKATCKAYRVYFSTPPTVKPGQDYLVDHSIYFYLMDPEGDFVEAIGRNFTAEQAAKVISDHVGDWRGPLNKKDRWA